MGSARVTERVTGQVTRCEPASSAVQGSADYFSVPRSVERLVPPELELRLAELTPGLRLRETELCEVELAPRLEELELRDEEE